MCTVWLADAGARTIKIERAEGETARNHDSAVKGTSAYFAWPNRGKESAVLEIMLSKASVLVQDFIPSTLHRMGLTPDFPSLFGVCK
jgi:itaconate CoA-transferase